MTKNLQALACVAVVSVAACGGPVGPVVAPHEDPATPLTAPAQISRGTLRVFIPNRATPAAAKSPDFVVSQTASGVLTVYATPDFTGPTTTVTLDFTAPGACTPTTGGKTCTASFAAPAGSDSFSLTTYDASGHALGLGRISTTIVLDQTNTVNFAIGGLPVSLAIVGLPLSVPADAAATVPFTVTALDADGNTIVAGAVTVTNGTQTTTDGYPTPISLSATSDATSPVVSVAVDGDSNVTQFDTSADTTSLLYTGGAFTTPVALSVSATNGSVTSPTRTVPLFDVTSTSPNASTSAAGVVSLAFTAAGQSASLVLNEERVVGTYAATVTNAGTAACPAGAIALSPIEQPAAGQTEATLTVTTSLAASGCTIALSDGASSVSVASVTTLSGGSILVPNPPGTTPTPTL